MAEVPIQPQTNKQGINWKNILIGAVIGFLVVGVIGALVFYLYRSDSEETTPTTTSKTSTPSAKKATSSAEKDEAADWKTYEGKAFKVRFKVPPDWKVKEREKVVNDQGTQIIPPEIYLNDQSRNRRIYIWDFYTGGEGIRATSLPNQQIIIDGVETSKHYIKVIPPDLPDIPNGMIVRVKSGNVKYALFATWERDDFQQADEIIDEFLKTIDFL